MSWAFRKRELNFNGRMDIRLWQEFKLGLKIMVVSEFDKDKRFIEVKVICICKIAGKEKEMADFQTTQSYPF